jgi:hypothetical protein
MIDYHGAARAVDYYYPKRRLFITDYLPRRCILLFLVERSGLVFILDSNSCLSFDNQPVAGTNYFLPFAKSV